MSTDLDRIAAARYRFFTGTAGDDLITGSVVNDDCDVSQGGNDTLRTGTGQDIVRFGATFAAGDRFDGGYGIDRLYLEGTYSALTITDTMLTAVEAVYLTATGTSRLVFSAAAYADPGNRFTIVLASAPETDITIDVTGVRPGVEIQTGAGNDHILSGAGDDYLVWQTDGGTDRFVGGRGVDVIDFHPYTGIEPDGVTIDLRLTRAQSVGTGSIALSGVDGVDGTAGDDRLTGNDAANRFVLHGGSDIVHAGGGDDYISFQDVIVDAADRVLIDGGAGFDIFSIASTATNHLSLTTRGTQAAAERTYTITGVEGLSGGIHDDMLDGDRNANILIGYGGNDRLSGGAGDDLLAGSGSVSWWGAGEARAWVVDPTVSQLYSDDDMLDGGAGNDTLYGNLGADTMIGGAGADRLTGGEGRDLFVYRAASDSRGAAIDTITDFETGDRIDVSAIDADAALVGNQAFHLGASAARAGDIVWRYDAARDETLLTLFTNADARADMTIRFAGNIAFTSADFVF